jgi:acetylglutamate kinase
MENLKIKSQILVESLPYIQKYHGKTVVIKFGGSTMKDKKSENSVIKDIVLMKLVGMKPVIVHGGGNDINIMLERLNIEPNFIEGLRVTDKKTIEVVEMVLAGKINKNLVNKIQLENAESVGISGKDCRTLMCKKNYVNGKDIGYVGKIEKVNNHLLHSLIDNDIIPVIAPIGTDIEGNTYNINADTAASAIAASLKAENLIYLTDVDGIYRDFDDKDSLISKLDLVSARELIKEDSISGGMIPKIQNCIESLENGIENIHMINGNIEHCLLFEIFTDKGIGTTFTQDNT